MILRRIVPCASALASAVALLSTAVSAADMLASPRKAPVTATPAYNWSGVYVGLNAGYSWGDVEVSYLQIPGGGFGAPICNSGCQFNRGLSPDGFIGGGQIGFNIQNGNWVFGLEADVVWRQGKQTTTFPIQAPPLFIDMLTFSTEQNWLGTGKMRLGVASSNWLFYGTYGVAFGNVRQSVTQSQDLGGGLRDTRVFSTSRTKLGWTGGVGIEWGLAPNWSLGLEYLYVDLGNETVQLPAQTALPQYAAATAEFDHRSHILRAKMNWRFGLQ